MNKLIIAGPAAVGKTRLAKFLRENGLRLDIIETNEMLDADTIEEAQELSKVPVLTLHSFTGLKP